MGRVGSKLTKPLREFNIENRARRALEKQQEKAIASPKHPSTVDHISKVQKESQLDFQEQQGKNEALHEKLKGLYVESDQLPREKSKTLRPLPEARQANPETDMGVMDTSHQIPEGRANLKTILHFIGQHQIDPDVVTAQSISHDYLLKTEDVDNILKHFKALNLHIPQEMYKQNSKLKKIVAEQINSASSSVAQLRLSLPKDDLNTDPSTDKT